MRLPSQKGMRHANTLMVIFTDPDCPITNREYPMTNESPGGPDSTPAASREGRIPRRPHPGRAGFNPGRTPGGPGSTPAASCKPLGKDDFHVVPKNQNSPIRGSPHRHSFQKRRNGQEMSATLAHLNLDIGHSLFIIGYSIRSLPAIPCLVPL